MRTHSNYLIDGPIMLTPERREARVAEMATELLAHNAYADQAVALNTLRQLGFGLMEAILLAPDAMQFAAQHGGLDRDGGRMMPEAPYSLNGTRRTHEFRVRVTWFGLAVIEEKIACRDGTAFWQRCSSFDGPFEIKRQRE